MTSLDLTVIGNCQVAALLDQRGRYVWACLPRFDGDPAFCALLAGTDEPEAGYFDVQLAGFARSEQRYIPNTAMVETLLYDDSGGVVRMVDFAPRFEQHGRVFRPIMFVRTLTPVSGSPRVRVRLRPLGAYGSVAPALTYGSNHIRYVLPNITLRLTTDASVTSVLEELYFVLDEPVTLVLGPDETLADAASSLGGRFHDQTRHYWEWWTRGLSIPFEWQEAVIRAAITLKLCTFEDTGAVVAALTTSIPEAPNSGRNWDYRYCWLRDSYFVVHALNRLGATRTMEQFLHYIVNIAAGAENGRLQPVYGLSGRARLTEETMDSLPGYRGMGPVRVGNLAYEQVQNDVYGAVILAATQYFFDQRLTRHGDETTFQRLEQLGERAAELYAAPDAGIWEYRGRQRVHTYSSVMCWAACDRLAHIARHLGRKDRAQYWRKTADRIHAEVSRRAWNERLGCFTEAFERDELDASMLLLRHLRFLPAGDPRFERTVAAIEASLVRGRHMFRYGAADDFGLPETAFNVCNFWYIDALIDLGRREQARELFEHMLSCRTASGLLSEDMDPRTHEQWGNFPQTYSMVGIITAAMRLSKSWEEAL
jgi:GH15 family glucan-1,4-alpha-glucosidase